MELKEGRRSYQQKTKRQTMLTWIKKIIGPDKNRKKYLMGFALKISSNKLDHNDIGAALSVFQARNKIKEELFDFILAQDDLKAIVNRHNCSKDKIRNLYDHLISSGAGQWTNGFHVATASIGYPETLEVLLKSFDGKEWAYEGYDAKNSAIKIVYDLCLHFDKM